ncbi:MAG: hypothetical protein EOM40_03225 [Clostridia bacterium]|nr:hypothetical protein [Clostridia bacterium]NCC42985.1 hypothetical protein [Clostridia bacterium]
MKKCLACIRCGFMDGCAYRSYFITGLLANFIQVAVLYYVWRAIFAYQEVINGFTWEVMQQYVFVAFLCNSVFTMGFEMNTAKRIIKGDIILDLIKPIGYRKMLFFRMLGTAGMEFGAGVVLVGGIYLVVNGVEHLNLLRSVLFFVSLLLGMGIKFCIQYIFSLLCFFTDNAYGVTKAREVLTNFFSGALIPLAMFPGILRDIVGYLPFQGIIYTPCCIFIGNFSMRESLMGIGMQVLWILVLGVLGTLFGKKAFGVISMYGG